MLAPGARPAAEAWGIKEGLGTIRRHKWLVLTITALVTLATAYLLHRQPRRYQAVATIRLVDAQQQIAGNLDNTPSSFQSMGGAWTDPIASEMQVIQSRAVGEAVADSQPLGLQIQVDGFPAWLVKDPSIASVNA